MVGERHIGRIVVARLCGEGYWAGCLDLLEALYWERMCVCVLYESRRKEKAFVSLRS
jgi:hypothetical protein